MESLATKYRPKSFTEVVGQEMIVKILSRQIELGQFKNAYMFCGPSGCGKTTLARIFASEINKAFAGIIEIDAASNSGVDNVRQIIDDAYKRSIDAKYKIYIIDECHSLSNQAWQAFLKCIEEPPTFTIFMFCTTDPQKVPETILNRCMRFNIQRVPSDQIYNRLNYICEAEGFTNYDESTDLISKMCKNQVRDAIALLDKVAAYDKRFDFAVTSSLLGGYSYLLNFKIINALIDGNQKDVLTEVDNLYSSGVDLKYFVGQLLRFSVDVLHFILFKDLTGTTIPIKHQNLVLNSINFDNADKYYDYIIDRLNTLKNTLKNDVDPKTTVEVALLQICRLN